MCLDRSQNKQRLLPYTTLKDCFLYPTRRVFTARYGHSPYIKHTLFVFKAIINYPAKIWLRGTNHEDSRYAIFSSLLPLTPWIQFSQRLTRTSYVFLPQNERPD
jgi:hypothetical protein